MKKVIAIVVSFNRCQLLEKVLNALLNQSFQIENIIVVDNNSSDNTFELIQNIQINNQQIIYHNTQANLGGAGGFARGFELAKTFDFDYLWLMDDDFLPTISCLENLIKAGVDIAQANRFNLDESYAELSALTYNLTNPFKLNPKGQSVKQFLEANPNFAFEKIKITVFPFEGPLISKQVVEHLNPPNPKFFIFGDDIDYSLQAFNHNFNAFCVLNAKAYRLLQNNQDNDLNSWKGYFMLRNLFYMHYQYGKNILVKYKPFVLCVGFIVISFLKGNFQAIKTAINAFADYKTLDNSEQHKP